MGEWEKSGGCGPVQVWNGKDSLAATPKQGVSRLNTWKGKQQIGNLARFGRESNGRRWW